MKKKLLPFILGLSMIAATPLAAHADNDLPEKDSGNVIYPTQNGFATISDDTSGDTDVVTAIPECTMTIPKDTTIKKGALAANIGRVTIDGHYFVKPYYVEVSAKRNNFKLVTGTDTQTGAETLANDDLAKHDIIFDVSAQSKKDTAANYEPDINGNAHDNKNFVQTNEVGCDGSTFKTTRPGGGDTYACRRFWKNEALSDDAAEQVAKYNAGEITDVNGQENVWLRISSEQWTGAPNNVANTKPVSGKYKGSITFTARFLDDYASDMTDWAAYTKTDNP